MNAGKVSGSLPLMKKTGLALLTTAYSSESEAAEKIPGGLKAFYQKQYPDLAVKRYVDITASGKAIAEDYAHNL